MYAIVRTGGHQLRVAEGDVVEIEHIAGQVGDSVALDEVLLVGGDTVRVGAPLVAGASVKATILGDTKGKKVVVLKYKNKNRYRRKTGHRQRYTRVRIDAISA